MPGLRTPAGPERINHLSFFLYERAMLLEGVELKDHQDVVNQLNRLLD
jgi:HSP90 family molecular chaperone